MKSLARAFLSILIASGLAMATDAQASNGLNKQIKEQQAKVAALQKQMDAGHGRIERKLGLVVRLSASIRDTKSSGSRAARIKTDLLKELGALIEFYRKEKIRVERKAKGERSGAVKDMWEEQAAVADYLIEKRLDEIIKIAGSLKNYPAYGEDDDDDGLSPNAKRDAAKRIAEELVNVSLEHEE